MNLGPLRLFKSHSGSHQGHGMLSCHRLDLFTFKLIIWTICMHVVLTHEGYFTYNLHLNTVQVSADLSRSLKSVFFSIFLFKSLDK